MITARRDSICSLMPVYEENYRLMCALVPVLRAVRAPTTLILADFPRISFSVLECARYTSVIAIHHGFGTLGDGRLLKDIEMTVRVYHDARLVEVLSYQGSGRLAPFYRVPNAEMLGPFEKRQVNLFLTEWLRACAEHGHRLDRQSDLYAALLLATLRVA